MWGLQASHSTSVFPSHALTSQGGLCPLWRTPELGRPTMAWNAHSPGLMSSCNLPFPLSPLPETRILTQPLFFPSHLIMCLSFLQCWLYKHPFSSFQLAFHGNFYICRYVLICLLEDMCSISPYSTIQISPSPNFESLYCTPETSIIL